MVFVTNVDHRLSSWRVAALARCPQGFSLVLVSIVSNSLLRVCTKSTQPN